MLTRTMLALAIAVLTFSSLATAKVGEAKAEDIRQLMELTGTDDIPGQLANAVEQQTLSAIQRANPDAGEQAEQIVSDVVAKHIEQADGRGKLTTDVVAIYAETFTHDEIRQLIDFYETPLGSKVVEQMPQVMRQAMSAGQQWARERMPAVQQEQRSRLQQAGLLPERSSPRSQPGMRPAPGTTPGGTRQRQGPGSGDQPPIP